MDIRRERPLPFAVQRVIQNGGTLISRSFEDEQGETWVVSRLGSSLEVKGRRTEGTSLNAIARSCARKLGVTQTTSGVPLEYVNQHRRIWSLIWDRGRPA